MKTNTLTKEKASEKQPANQRRPQSGPSAKRGQSGRGKDHTKRMRLPLDRITCSRDVQPRVETDKGVVEEYAEQLKANAKLPPIDVFFDGTKYWLAEGFHRFPAHKQAGRKRIDCIVHQGSKEDAQWHAVQSNKTHGLRRSNEDKQRAVMMALRHPKGATLSDRAIAACVGVSITTVGKYRKEAEPTVQIGQSTKRTGRDGRKIETANIGKGKKGKAKPEPKPEVEAPGASLPAAASVDVGSRTPEPNAAQMHAQKGLEGLGVLIEALQALGLAEVHADALKCVRSDLDRYAAGELAYAPTPGPVDAPVQGTSRSAKLQPETCDRVEQDAGDEEEEMEWTV